MTTTKTEARFLEPILLILYFHKIKYNHLAKTTDVVFFFFYTPLPKNHLLFLKKPYSLLPYYF